MLKNFKSDVKEITFSYQDYFFNIAPRRDLQKFQLTVNNPNNILVFFSLIFDGFQVSRNDEIEDLKDDDLLTLTFCSNDNDSKTQLINITYKDMKNLCEALQIMSEHSVKEFHEEFKKANNLN